MLRARQKQKHSKDCVPWQLGNMTKKLETWWLLFRMLFIVVTQQFYCRRVGDSYSSLDRCVTLSAVAIRCLESLLWCTWDSLMCTTNWFLLIWLGTIFAFFLSTRLLFPLSCSKRASSLQWPSSRVWARSTPQWRALTETVIYQEIIMGIWVWISTIECVIPRVWQSHANEACLIVKVAERSIIELVSQRWKSNG